MNPKFWFHVPQTWHMWYFFTSTINFLFPKTVYNVITSIFIDIFSKYWVYINPKISGLVDLKKKRGLQNFRSWHMWSRKKLTGYISISFIWFQLAFWGYVVRDTSRSPWFFYFKAGQEQQKHGFACKAKMQRSSSQKNAYPKRLESGKRCAAQPSRLQWK